MPSIYVDVDSIIVLEIIIITKVRIYLAIQKPYRHFVMVSFAEVVKPERDGR